MNSTEVEELVAKGVAALENGHTHLALVCMEKAIAAERSPLVCSTLGFCLAAARGEFERGTELCREAISLEPANPRHYYHLGRVLVLAGRKDEGIQALRQGLTDRKDDRIIAELERLGTRKPPPIKALPRDHFLNKWLGIVLSRVGFR